MRFIIKKLFFLAVLLMLCCFFSAERSLAEAFSLSGFSGGLPTKAMNEILNDLGVKKAELRYFIQTFNVSRKKKQQPQVSLSFDPTSPTPGQKVTAVATPTYFLNDSKDLYFTWYLKKNGCSEQKKPEAEKKKKCDSDNDGDIDINDYKVTAMRTIANNDFDWDKDGNGSPDSEIYSKDSDNDGYNAIWGGDDQRGKDEYCFVHDVASGDEYEIDCDEHLFPEYPSKYLGEDLTNRVIGDNSFDKEEEFFWHTNPKDPDTADSGNGDEANVTGLGTTSFSWVYESGDEVGVVVEGISVDPTQKNDSSYRTMWAMLKNECDLGKKDSDYPKITNETITNTTIIKTCDDSTNEEKDVTVDVTEESIVNSAGNVATIRTKNYTEVRHYYCNGNYDVTSTTHLTSTCPQTKNDGDSYYGYTCSGHDDTVTLSMDDFGVKNIKKASDLNKCLSENMIEPTEGGGVAGKLEVNLTYSPEFPMNDSSGEKGGDRLVIHSSVINPDNNGYLTYDWKVYESDEMNPDSWGKPVTKANLPDASPTNGLNISDFSFKLNRENTKKYLKIKLTVRENAGKNNVREGYNYVIVPISSSSEKIRVFNVNVSSDLIASLGEERCKSAVDKAVCPVAKNEIVGVRVPGKGISSFSWSINGIPITYKDCFFGGCSRVNGNPADQNIAYFPILEDPGFIYTVNLIGTNQETGQKINLSRNFVVAEPEVKIKSSDTETAKPTLLGNYVDLDGEYCPDYSQDQFETLTSSTVKLKPEFNFPVPKDFTWFINGTPVNSTYSEIFDADIENDGTLIFKTSDTYSATPYTVTINAIYSQDNNTKKLLNKHFGVVYGEFYEKQLSDTIELSTVGSLSDIQGASGIWNRKKILASVSEALPEYINFLLRLVLTAFLIIIASKIILSFFPKVKRYEI